MLGKVALVTGSSRNIGRAIAEAVAWLASDEAAYVNGTTIGVNGGWGA